MTSIDKKSRLREEIISKRKELNHDFITEKSRIINAKLRELDVYQSAAAVYTYIGCRGEVLTDELISCALSDGKKVAVPKTGEKDISFHYIDGATDLVNGRYSIPEPNADNPANDVKPLVIVPGVAFDKKRNRLGHGRAYYDRFLKDGYTTVGLAFDFQIVDEVPTEDTDIPMDIIITETQII